MLVIDSINFPQEVRGVSELTFDLLSERVVHKRKIPLLVACNKQDMALARGCSNIQKELEKEMYGYQFAVQPLMCTCNLLIGGGGGSWFQNHF